MSASLPIIIKTAAGLLDDVERVVPVFPNKYRHLLGQNIRAEALQGALLTQYAMMMKGGQQFRYLQELKQSNDRLKLLLQTAHHNSCFKSAGQYEAVAERARSVGRQCHALIRNGGQQHPNGQNAGASVPPAASRDTEYPGHPIGVNA